MKKRRLLALVLVFCMMLSMVPTHVRAEETNPTAGQARNAQVLNEGINDVSLPENTDKYFTFTPAEDGEYWFGCPFYSNVTWTSVSNLTSQWEYFDRAYTVRGDVYSLTANNTYTFVLNSQDDFSGTINVKKVGNSSTLYVAASNMMAYTGDTITVNADFEMDAIDHISATSNNESVARIVDTDPNCAYVELLSAGKATITLTSRGGGTATCDLTVYPSVDGGQLELDKAVPFSSDPTKIRFTYTPTESGLYWLTVPANVPCNFYNSGGVYNEWFRSENAEYDGMVYGLNAGETYNFSVEKNGYWTGEVKLIKTQYATGISFDEELLEGYEGNSFNVGFTLYPANSVTQNISVTTSGDGASSAYWDGQNPFVYVSMYGVGKDTITVTTNEGCSDSLTATVKDVTITSFTVDPVIMTEGLDTKTLTLEDGTSYQVYDPGNKNPEVHITYSNGDTVTYYWGNLPHSLGLKVTNVNDLQTTADWEVGKYTWPVNLVDQSDGSVLTSFDMTVTVEENPIASVSIAPVTFKEVVDKISDGDHWIYLVTAKNPNVTFEYIDGSTLTCPLWNLDQYGYRVNDSFDSSLTASWTVGEYAWRFEVLDDQNRTIAICDVPVTIEKVDRYFLTDGIGFTLSLNQNVKKVLEYTADEDGYLWLCMDSSKPYTFMNVDKILEDGYNRVWSYEHESDNQIGPYIKVAKGKTYEIVVSSWNDYEQLFTPTFMTEASDIIPEESEVTGYVGQTIWLEYESIPAGSMATVSVTSDNNSVADYRGGAQEIGIGMNSAGNAKFTVTVGNNTHTIQVTVKDPEPVYVGDTVNVDLDPGESIVYRFSPKEDGNYFFTMPKTVENLVFEGSAHSIRNTAEYNRIRLDNLQANAEYLLIFTNKGSDSQQFDMTLGKAVALTADDMIVTGPTEVEYGAEGVELQLSVPQFADYDWIRWDPDDWSIVGIDTSNDWSAKLDIRNAGKVTITIDDVGATGVQVTHTLTVKEYGENTLEQWIGTANGETVTMTFTPETDGYYFLHWISLPGDYPSPSVAPYPQKSYAVSINGFNGEVHKLEGGKTYNFESWMYGDYKVYMIKVEAASSVTIPATLTGKVHEQLWLSVEYDDFCSWTVESSDENIVMFGGANNSGVNVFLLNEGNAVLTVTDQEGREYTCNVTVFGELGTEDFEGRDEMGLAAGDSQTYNFTPNTTGLYWINSELDHQLGITVEQNGTPVSAEYEFNTRRHTGKYGAVYSLTEGVTYQITFSSDHNMTTFVNAEWMPEANYISDDNYTISGNEGYEGDIYFSVYKKYDDGGVNNAVGDVRVTSSDENVIKITYFDGAEFRYELVGGGEAAVTIEVNGEKKEIPVVAIAAVKVTGISVDNVTMIHGMDTSTLTFDDGSSYQVYDPATKNPVVQITYSDGTSAIYRWNDIESCIGLRMGHDNDLKTTEKWTPGAYAWTVDISDEDGEVLATYTMTITIKENPIASVTAEAVTLTEVLEQYTTYIEGDYELFFDIGRSENVQFTITYSDNTSVTCSWWEVEEKTGGQYRIENVIDSVNTYTWTAGHSYTWRVALRDNQGGTYAYCDIPANVVALEKQTITLDTATALVLDSYESKILEFTATEDGYLCIWDAKGDNSVRYALDENYDRIYLSELQVDGKFGQYLPVKKGTSYQIVVSAYADAVNTTVTASMLPEATGIVLEKTELTCYVGQDVWVNFTVEPVGSVANYTVDVEEPDVATWYGGGSESIGFFGRSANTTTATVTVGSNTYTITIHVKDPEPLNLDTETPVKLAPSQEIVYSFTPAEDGDYILCMPYSVENIAFACPNAGEYYSNSTGEYQRFVVCGMVAGQTYRFVISNPSEETQTFNMSVGKAVEATSISILGPTEVEYNAERVELLVAVAPKYGVVNNLRWDVDNYEPMGSQGMDQWYYWFEVWNPGTINFTASTEEGLIAHHTVSIKAYGEDAAGKWIGRIENEPITFSFTPDEDGYYFLHTIGYDGSFPEPTSADAEPLFSFDFSRGEFWGVVHQLEAGKTYTFASNMFYGDYRFYMTKEKLATSIEIPASITGKVHEHSSMDVVTNGVCDWDITSSNENVVMVRVDNSEHVQVLLVGEGTAVLTITDQSGNTYKSNVTVSGELDVVDFDGRGLLGLVAGDSITYSFTPGETGLYWINSEHNHKLDISVVQNGTVIEGAICNNSEWFGRYGAYYTLIGGTTYMITYSTDHNVVTDINAEPVHLATQFQLYDTEIRGDEGENRWIQYNLYDEEYNYAVGQITATSSNESVVKIHSVDFGRTVLELVGEGEATITIKVEGLEAVVVPVTVNKVLNLTLGEKLDVTYEESGQVVVARFTPEKSGYYAIYMDAAVSGEVGVGGFWGQEIMPGTDGCMKIYLEAGETYGIYSYVHEYTESMAAKVWIEEAVYATGLELVSLPDKLTYYAGGLSTGLNIAGITLKITWSDGTSTTCTGDQMAENGLMVNGYGISISPVENEAGTAGVVEITCCNAETSFNVTLEPNPVSSIEVLGQAVLPENTYGDDGPGFWYYSPDLVRDMLQLKINYTDGTSVTIPASQARLHDYAIESDLPNVQWRQPWTKETANTVSFSYLGHEDTIDVQIRENWIKKVEVLSTPTAQFYYGDETYGWNQENGNYIFHPANYDQYKGLSFRVTYTDGTSEIVTPEQFQWPYGSAYDRSNVYIFGWYKGLPVEIYVDTSSYGEYLMVVEFERAGEMGQVLRYGGKTDSYALSLLPTNEHKHVLTEVPAVAATYEASGNIRHWMCSGCDLFFADAAGKTVISYEDVFLPMLVKVEVTEEEVDQVIEEVLNSGSGDSSNTGVKEVVLPLTESNPDSSVTSVSLPTASIEKVLEANNQIEDEIVLTVEMNTATVTLDSTALSAIADQVETSDITLVVEQIEKTALTQNQQDAVKNQNVEMVISAELIGGEASVHDFQGGTATVKIPFNPSEGSIGSDYKIMYVADDGTTEMIDTTYVDGYLVFTLDHFSEYVVVNERICFEIAFANMTLQNSLAMNFAFAQGHVSDWTGYYVEIVKTYADGRPDTVVQIPYGDQWKYANINGAAHYYVTFDGIAAKEMCDEIHVTVYNSEGRAVTSVWEDSVRAYAMRLLNNPAYKNQPKTLTMAVDMLNYGAASQSFFGYNTEDLANSQLSAEQKSWATQNDPVVTNKREASENYVGTSLTLESKILLNMAFKNGVQGMYATVSFVDHYGKQVNATADLKISGGYAVVDIDEIAVADGRQPVTVTVYNANGSVHATATDSVEGYLARVSALDPLFVMIMKFADSAHAFFH